MPRTIDHRPYYSKYGSIRILPDGRVRFSAYAVPGHPEIDFLVVHSATYVRGNWSRSVYYPQGHSVLLEIKSNPVFSLGLKNGRVHAGSLIYQHVPDELRKVVALVREIGNGLEHWLTPALEYHLGDNIVKRKHPEVHKIIPELLESVRDLPVAEAWLRERRSIQRHWAKLLRKDPSKAAEAPAPWVLEKPDSPPRRRGRKRPAR